MAEERSLQDPLLSDSSPGNLQSEIWYDDGTDLFYHGKSIQLVLSKNCLKWYKNDESKHVIDTIDLKDIIGCSIKEKNKKTQLIYELTVFIYQIPSSGCCTCCSTSIRNRSTATFTTNNDRAATNWKNAINCASRGIQPSKDTESGLIDLPPIRRFVVYVNPVGGKKQAVPTWNKVTKPMFEEASIEYDLVITERANHAKDDANTRDLSTVNALVVIGGDGLVFEVVNGLASRKDNHYIMATMPIIHIPGGSGNGLAKSVLHESGEEYSPLSSTFVGIKGKPSSLDLSIVNTKSLTHLSFLILGWGLISDSDILSESLRWMGEPRFTLAGAYNILRKKLYRGRLSLLMRPEDLPESNEVLGGQYILPPFDVPLEEPTWKIIEDDFILVWVVQTSHCSASMYSGPGCTLDDGLLTVIVCRGLSRLELLVLMDSADKGDHMDHPKAEVYRVKAYRLEPLTEEGIYSLDGEVVEYGPIQGVVQPAALRVMKL